MPIITWNVRGINSSERKLDFSNLLHSHKPTLAGILEHKLSDKNIDLIQLNYLNDWNLIHNNSMGGNGRIIAIWDPNIW